MMAFSFQYETNSSLQVLYLMKSFDPRSPLYMLDQYLSSGHFEPNCNHFLETDVGCHPNLPLFF